MWKKVLRFLIQLIKNILTLLLLYSFILYCTDEILFYQFLDSIYFFLLAKIIKIHTFYKKLTNELLFLLFSLKQSFINLLIKKVSECSCSYCKFCKIYIKILNLLRDFNQLIIDLLKKN